MRPTATSLAAEGREWLDLGRETEKSKRGMGDTGFFLSSMSRGEPILLTHPTQGGGRERVRALVPFLTSPLSLGGHSLWVGPGVEA